MSLQTPDTNVATYVDFTKVSREPVMAPELHVSQPYLMNGFSLTSGNGPDIETFGQVSSVGIIMSKAFEPTAAQFTMIPPTYNGMRLAVAPDGVPLQKVPDPYRIGINNQMDGPGPLSNFGLPTIPEKDGFDRRQSDEVGVKAESAASEKVNKKAGQSAARTAQSNSENHTYQQRRDARTFPTTDTSGGNGFPPEDRESLREQKEQAVPRNR